MQASSTFSALSVWPPIALRKEASLYQPFVKHLTTASRADLCFVSSPLPTQKKTTANAKKIFVENIRAGMNCSPNGNAIQQLIYQTREQCFIRILSTEKRRELNKAKQNNSNNKNKHAFVEIFWMKLELFAVHPEETLYQVLYISYKINNPLNKPLIN